jgi:RNA polymerase sigma factor (sigma-70 family)
MLTARDSLTAEPLLTAAEESALSLQIEAGALAAEARAGGRSCPGATPEELLALESLGEVARQRFIRANLRLVAKIARQAASRTQLPDSDLFQEGCLGLICAVERFDCRRGYKFSTYASFWVRAYVWAAAANLLGALNVPAGRAQQQRLVRSIEVELAQVLGRSATLAEVAAQLGRSEKWTAELKALQVPRSLEGLEVEVVGVSPSTSGEQAPSHDRPGGELLWHLHGLEREVLLLRYGFTDGTAHTYAEIGARLTITASRARRLEHRALEVLRSVCPSAAADHL